MFRYVIQLYHKHAQIHPPTDPPARIVECVKLFPCVRTSWYIDLFLWMSFGHNHFLMLPLNPPVDESIQPGVDGGLRQTHPLLWPHSLSVTSQPVCDLTVCLSPHSLSVTSQSVCDLTACLSPHSLSVTSQLVCDLTARLWPYSTSGASVCTSGWEQTQMKMFEIWNRNPH